MSTSTSLTAPILIQTSQRDYNTARGAVIGGTACAVCGTILMLIDTAYGVVDRPLPADNQLLTYLLVPIVMLVTAPIKGALAGLLVGGIAGAIGARVGGIARRRSANQLIGTLVGALVGATLGSALFTQMAPIVGTSWSLLFLCYQSNIAAGAAGGYVGASPDTAATKAMCGACRQYVRPDAASCKYCGVVFGKQVATLASPPGGSRWRGWLNRLERQYLEPHYQKPVHHHRH